MKRTLLSSLLISSLVIVMSACHNSEITYSELQKINAKLAVLDETLQNTQKEQKVQERNSLAHTLEEQRTLFASTQRQIEQLKEEQNKAFQNLIAEQNANNALLKKSQKILQTKPQIVYKNKKEIAKLQDKLVLGQEESALIEPIGLILRARIDTGAHTSSIDARNIEEFERDGKKWVRFTLIDRHSKKPYVIEKKVIRIASITQSSRADSDDKRIVVKLKIKLGDFSGFSEFTLANRNHMEFPLLIGRSFLQDIAIVDVSAKDLAPIQKEEKK